MKVAAIVLAAGMSTRMGANKLLQDIGGEPLICRAVRVVAASQVAPLLVVLGHEAVQINRALAHLKCRTINNLHYRDGLGSSIRAGIGCLPDDCDGALIVLGDMPSPSSSLMDRMIGVFDEKGTRAICVATHNGLRGHPVLFALHYFPDLLMLEGDSGARRILIKNAAHVCEIEAGDDGPLVDIDTLESLQTFRARSP